MHGPKAAYDKRASGGYGRATLVICPLVAVLQWRQEIERFTNPGTLKVDAAALALWNLTCFILSCCRALLRMNIIIRLLTTL